VIIDKLWKSQCRLWKCVAERLEGTVALKSTSSSEAEGDIDMFQG